MNFATLKCKMQNIFSSVSATKLCMLVYYMFGRFTYTIHCHLELPCYPWFLTTLHLDIGAKLFISIILGVCCPDGISKDWPFPTGTYNYMSYSEFKVESRQT